MAEQRYEPYGEPRWVSGMLPTEFGYTGQRADAYTQLVEMGVRWYSPRLGRWISPDTIVPDPANPQSLNRYSYVNNRPLTFVDPSGHWMELGGGLGVRETPDGTLRVLHGGDRYVNYTEVLHKNYELSGGDPRYLERSPVGAKAWNIEFSLVATYAEEDDSSLLVGLILPAAQAAWNQIKSKTGLDSSLPSSQYADAVGDPDRVGYGYSGVGVVPASPVVPLGRGSTGRTTPHSLKEQLAMEEVMSDPRGGPVPVQMGDSRWPASAGWLKRQQIVNGIRIHYNWNPETGQYDDFKFDD